MKLTPEQLLHQRLERRKQFPAPTWADHVLHGTERPTTAKSVNFRTMSVKELGAIAAIRRVA